ncbi:AT-rich interactive domain-containing protein 3 isoform X2 [Daucus carota subsp. sativus]|uniref:AT-rich interactive domain-containing protein 3 isoform X2 n=1 Tax=Daucus carota subsp. sativus TaxID=79200 RepID=UPI0030828500
MTRLGRYDQVLLEYERHKSQNIKPRLDLPSVPEPLAAGNVTTGSGRATRDAATHAMQGWHAQHPYGYEEIAQPNIKTVPPVLILVLVLIADWVKINVRENIDFFEVYALVPGLLREELLEFLKFAKKLLQLGKHASDVERVIT